MKYLGFLCLLCLLSACPGVHASPVKEAQKLLETSKPFEFPGNILFAISPDRPLYDKQIKAIEDIAAHPPENESAHLVDILIPFLNYPKEVGAVSAYFGPSSFEKLKEDWPAFAALLAIKGTEQPISAYCLDQHNIMKSRLASLMVLRYKDESLFKETATKILSELDPKSPEASYVGHIMDGAWEFSGFPEPQN